MPCQEMSTAPTWHAWAAFPLTHPGPSNPVPGLTSKARLSCSKQQDGQQRIKGNPVLSGALRNEDHISCHLILADPCCCSSKTAPSSLQGD